MGAWPLGGEKAASLADAGLECQYSQRKRNRAKARLNWVSQGQRRGRCKVRRRAERVIRPIRAKTRRLRALVITVRSPRPIRAVQRARLCAITWTASQAPLAAKQRRKVPRVDGALTTQPGTPTVPPARSASASSIQSPPASAEATRRACWRMVMEKRTSILRQTATRAWA